MTLAWKPALVKSAEMPRRCRLQGADIHSRPILVAVLLCASILIEECAFGRSTGCYAAATRSTPYYEAFLPNQRGRRLLVTGVQGRQNNDSPMHNKSVSSEPQEAAELEPGKSTYAGNATPADVGTQRNSAGDFSVDVAAAADLATEEKPHATSGLSSFDIRSLQRLHHQLPGAAASFLANRNGVMLVPPKNSGTLGSVDAAVGLEPEKRILTSPESETSTSADTRAPRAEDTSALIDGPQPAATGDHHAALKQPGAELAAPAGEREDRGGTGVMLTSPPQSGLEAFANAFRSPSALRPFVPTVPTETDPGVQVTPRDWMLPARSYDLSGIAVDAASKWEELSRQHQQMLLSRNLTSVIKLFVDFTQPDHMTPWQMQPPRQCTGSAFVVDGRLLLTNGHLVDWQTRVLARRHGNARKFNASVVAVGHDCDLALLTVEAEEFWDGLQPLTFGQIPQLRDTVTVLGYPTGGDQLSITEGVVSRIGMSKYVHSSYELLTVQIDAAINPGNSGGPALVAGKVVGVAFQGFSELQSIGYIVPYPVIRHFLNDLALHKRFTGFPTLGIKVTNLENQGMKEYKKLTSLKPSDLPEGITATGVVVVDVDSLRKERYLKGLMRLPYASTVLPPDAQITQLLPEDPTQKVNIVPTTSPSLRQPRLTGLSPETADSLASLPSVGAHATASLPTSAAAGSSGAAPDGHEHRSASPVARGAETSKAAYASTGPRSNRQGQQQEKDDENEQHPQVEKNQQVYKKTEKRENKSVTSEDDLIVPNVHYTAQQVLGVDHVGFEVGDVLLAVDGIDVADDGTVPFRGMERNQLEFTLMNRFNGEGVKALVLRDGKLMNILAPLTMPNMMIPLHTWDVKPKYFVFGGLVFVQLTKILMEHTRCTDIPNFVYALVSRMDYQEKEKDEIIVLSLILPSELTIGYNQAPSVVRKVQGHAVRNFEEMVQLVEECTDPFIEFIVEVEGCKEVPIVVDRKKAVELNPKIREQHGIPRDRSLFL